MQTSMHCNQRETQGITENKVILANMTYAVISSNAHVLKNTSLIIAQKYV